MLREAMVIALFLDSLKLYAKKMGVLTSILFLTPREI